MQSSGKILHEKIGNSLIAICAGIKLLKSRDFFTISTYFKLFEASLNKRAFIEAQKEALTSLTEDQVGIENIFIHSMKPK